MKNQLGIVITNDGNSAKVKITKKKHKVKIIEAVNNEHADIGEEVYIEFNKILRLKIIYIKFIQPIIFAILGMLVGNCIGNYLEQPKLIYKCVFICLFVTIAFIYKDYSVEKNKLSFKYNPIIRRIK